MHVNPTPSSDHLHARAPERQICIKRPRPAVTNHLLDSDVHYKFNQTTSPTSRWSCLFFLASSPSLRHTLRLSSKDTDQAGTALSLSTTWGTPKSSSKLVIAHVSLFHEHVCLQVNQLTFFLLICMPCRRLPSGYRNLSLQLPADSHRSCSVHHPGTATKLRILQHPALRWHMLFSSEYVWVSKFPQAWLSENS